MQIAMAGMDPMVYLTTTDSTLRVTLLAVARKANKRREMEDQNRATLIANAVGKMLGG